MYQGWQEEYKRKLMSAEDAVKMIKSGDRVHIPQTSAPEALVNALQARRDELKDVHIDLTAPLRYYSMFEPGWEQSFDVTLWNHVMMARQAVDERRLDYLPLQCTQYAKVMEERGIRPIDFLPVTVCGPNERGFFCFSHDLWYKQSLVRCSKKILVEVNNNMPWCYGDTFIHVSQIDAIVDNTLPLLPWEDVVAAIATIEDPEKRQAVQAWMEKLGPSTRTGIAQNYLPYISNIETKMIHEFARMTGVAEPSEVDRAIAGYLSTLINDRDCIQIGVGTPSAFMVMCGVFDNKHDLGLHTEMAARGLARLVEEGVITGKYKTFMPGKAIGTSWAGCHEDEHPILDHNPKFELYDMSYINRPDIYMKNDNMAAINNAVSIDLTGQVNCETRFGPMIINGTGGQPETHIGCLYSKGGKSIHLLRSTAVGGTMSTIVGQFEPGTAVTIPKYWADHVVTEYGIARLMGKTWRERANELIAVAHPDFRAELRKQAQKMFYSQGG